jgi:hypothetical protein
LTLTKNLDVPRIGPPLDADDTPRRDRLVVEYNTSTNPVEDGLVQDTSGRGLDGAFYGDASYDATEKALVFDGNADNISGTIPGVSGEYVHSITLWVKINDALTYTLFEMGARSTDDLIGISISSSTINHYFYSNDNSYTGITPGSWHHLTFTYSGGSDLSNRKLYINGNEVSRTAHGGGSTGALTLANGNFTIGDIVGGAGSNDFKGSISNFKLYDTALTAEEVKTLYDMGRCDEGHHTVNFSKTRVGIGLGDGEAAQAALDVRGRIMREYNPGEIIEELNTVCNGRPVTVLSGTYTPTNVTASQTSSVTHTEINGSFITYNKPVGAKRIYYKFACQWEDNGYGAITNFKIRVYHNGAWRDINLSRYTHAAQYHAGGAADHHGHDWVVMEFVFECDADTESQHDGRFLSSKTSYTFDATWRNHANAYSSILHKTHWWDGGSGIIHPPQLTIRAIA